MSNEAKRTLSGISFGHLVIDTYAAILIPLYPLIAQNLGVNLAVISTVIAIGHSLSSILQPVFGFVSDKLNRRFFMFWGIIFSAVFIPLGFKAPNAFLLTVCLLLGIAGNAFYHPQVTIMIKDFYEKNENLSKAMGIFLGLGTIGYAFGPYLSTFFLKTFGESNYLYIMIFGVITAIAMLFYVPKIKPRAIVKNANFISALKEIGSNKICLFLIFVTCIKSLMIMSYGTYIPFLLKKYDFPITTIGLILTLFYISGGISMIISSKIEKYLKLKGMIALSYLPLLPLSMCAMYFLKVNTALAIAFFIATGFFVLLAAGVVLAHAQKLVPNNAGTISGIIQGFTLAVGSLLLIPVGIFGQHFGVEYSIILIGAAGFITALCALKIKL